MKKTVLAFSLILFLSLFLINNVKAEDLSCEGNVYWKKGNKVCEKECIYKFRYGNLYCEINFTTSELNFEHPKLKCYKSRNEDGTSEEAEKYDRGGYSCYKYSQSGKNYCLHFSKTESTYPTIFNDIKKTNKYTCTQTIGYNHDINVDESNAHDFYVVDFWISTISDKYLFINNEITINPFVKADDKSNDDKPNDDKLNDDKLNDNKPSYNPYDDIVKCDGANAINSIPSCWCMPAAVADITSFIYGFLRIGGPVLLIILGAIDLGKAIVATDESGIKKAKKKLINKFVAAASIFLVLSVIQMIVNITGGGKYGNLDKSNKNCLYYLLYGYES